MKKSTEYALVNKTTKQVYCKGSKKAMMKMAKANQDYEVYNSPNSKVGGFVG